jgi:c-di-GMP-binding flagellar brake protein YcgR
MVEEEIRLIPMPNQHDILIFSIIMGFLVVFLIVFALIQVVRRKRRRVNQSREAFERTIADKNLTPIEIGLLERLAGQIPTGRANQHLVVQSRSAFDAVVDRYRQKEEIPEVLLATLRMKLGFLWGDGKRPMHATSEMLEGTEVTLIQWQGEKAQGRVAEQRPDALVLRVEENRSVFESMTPLLVSFAHSNGVYAFCSQIIHREGSLLKLSHTEHFWKVQKRKYYRRQVTGPVMVTRAGSQEPPIQASLIELGGGGATIINPDKRLAGGEKITMVLQLKLEEKLTVQGEVVRLSKEESLAHIHFLSISDTMRDRILGYLFNTSESGAA